VIATRRQLIASAIISPAAACLCCPPPPALAAATTTATKLQQANKQDWTYGNPEGISQWQGVCKTGKYQSPIDIPLPENATSFDNITTTTAATPSSSLGTLRFRYSKFVKDGATVCNNGHGSPQVNFPPGFDLELGDKRFSLVQLHFHTPSEHSISGGQHFPIECHLVHRDNTTRELVVVAVLMKIGTANPVLQTALHSCPETPGVDAPLKKAVSLRSTLPPPRGTSGGRRYATYEGSLTTPPCTEKVRWVVLLDNVTVSAQQVLDLMAIGTNGKDWKQTERPLQPLNKRKIEYTL
jgi:carbonic anhydrase